MEPNKQAQVGPPSHVPQAGKDFLNKSVHFDYSASGSGHKLSLEALKSKFMTPSIRGFAA